MVQLIERELHGLSITNRTSGVCVSEIC